MNPITQWDISILTYVYEHIQQEWLTPIVTFITHLGKAGIIWMLLILVLLAIKKTRPVGIACLLGLVINVLACNVIIKPLVARLRPYDAFPELHDALRVREQWDYSFPSGHTSASFATAGTLPWMKVKKRYSIAALTLAVLIALSRIYVCVHYPSDVICGAILGAVAGFLGYLLYTKVLKDKIPAKVYEFDLFKKKENKAA